MKTITFREFVDSKCCPSSLDSIHGNLGLDMYSLICCKEAVENTSAKSELQIIKDLTKEDKLYIIDKGEISLFDYLMRTLDQDTYAEVVSPGLYKFSFEHGVNVYMTNGRYSLGGSYNGDSYINVRRVVLPCKSEIKKGPERIYIIGDSGVYYKLPKLPYPKSLKPFLKWAKKKKAIPFKPSGDSVYIWNKKPNPLDGLGNFRWQGEYADGDYPMWNIRTDAELAAYNTYIMNDFPAMIKEQKKKDPDSWHIPSAPKSILSPIDCPLLNEDLIEEFISAENNRFKIER